MPQVEDPLESLFGGKKTTKCFRFPANAVRELESEAKGKSISLNSLMNTLIMTYLKWGRFVLKRQDQKRGRKLLVDCF